MYNKYVVHECVVVVFNGFSLQFILNFAIYIAFENGHLCNNNYLTNYTTLNRKKIIFETCMHFKIHSQAFLNKPYENIPVTSLNTFKNSNYLHV